MSKSTSADNKSVFSLLSGSSLSSFILFQNVHIAHSYQTTTTFSHVIRLCALMCALKMCVVQSLTKVLSLGYKLT